MKNLIVFSSIVAALICGLLLIQKNSEVADVHARLAATETEREATLTQAEREEKKNKRLQSQLHQTRSEVVQSAAEAQTLKQELSKSRDQRPADALFRDPEMKEALIAQAKEGVEKSVKGLFKAGLAQELRLNEEQAAQLKYLLMEKMSLLSDQIMVPMMIGEVNEADMVASGKATRRAYDENVAKIRALLGEEGFNAYERFEKTEPERDNMRRLTSQFEKTGQTLSTDQQSQLLAAMMEERLNFKFQNDLGDFSQWDFEHWYDNFSNEKLTAYGQENEQLIDRMVQRAQAVLNPEQVAVLKTFLKQRAQQGMFVARSTTAMFAKRK